MRILYGVTGEGMGHAMRSRVLIEHLEGNGHEVLVAASGRAATYLARRCRDVVRIEGLTLSYREGRVSIPRSVSHLLTRVPTIATRNLSLYGGRVARFDPEVCLTDFDSFAHLFGKLTGRPVISIDHQHVLDRFQHAPQLDVPDLTLARAAVRAKLPGCRHYLVSSFYFPPSRPGCAHNTTLVGPIVRPELAALPVERGEHVLVYQTSTSDARLLPSLAALRGHRFVLYGLGARRSPAPNVELRPFSEEGFMRDLASARAVICNGGYTTLSEAVCLGKPVLSIPIQQQGEQQLNAAYLDALGLGVRAAAFDPDVVARFLETECAPRQRMAPGNRAACAALERALARCA